MGEIMIYLCMCVCIYMAGFQSESRCSVIFIPVRQCVILQHNMLFTCTNGTFPTFQTDAVYNMIAKHVITFIWDLFRVKYTLQRSEAKVVKMLACSVYTCMYVIQPSQSGIYFTAVRGDTCGSIPDLTQDVPSSV